MSYIADKNRELNILSKYCGKQQEFNLKNSKDFLLNKEKLIKEMKFYNFDKYYHDLSNKSSFNIDEYNLKYNYTYERFNGQVTIDNFVEELYGYTGFLYKHYFTNCGMSAIASLLTSLSCYNDVKVDLMYSETYFETIKLISNLTKNIEYTSKALYIDSIASDFSFNITSDILDRYDYIIIDTTCYLSNKYINLINRIVNELDKPCFLVRSHTKLDMAGTEYSHLGSVTFLYSQSIYTDKLGKIIEDCRHIIGVIGACLPPEKFPKFMIDKQFVELNEKRLARVEDNAEYMISLFNKHEIELKIPNHKQFCLYNFSNKNLELATMKDRIISFCKENNDIGIYHAVSFGFDFIALDGYENFNDKQFKIRISMCDFPKSLIEQISYKIIELIKQLENYEG
ncbi:MAG: hypothetical protein IJX26_00420 [Clostridia bacterium]|nr:hypothetical protein [Clostridia bacterium]